MTVTTTKPIWQGDLTRLEKIAREMKGHQDALDALRRQAASLIVRASDKGASRRMVAAAAGLTPARVQQIVEVHAAAAS